MEFRDGTTGMLAVHTPFREAMMFRQRIRQVASTVSMALANRAPLPDFVPKLPVCHGAAGLMARSATWPVGSTPGTSSQFQRAGHGSSMLSQIRRARSSADGGRDEFPKVLTNPGFETPDAFLQPDDHFALHGNCHLELTNQCLQGSDHGLLHPPECAQEPTLPEAL